MTITETRMMMIFNEWAARYAENPEEFSEILGEDEKPVADYGESCMRYFIKVANEMDESGMLPSPSEANDPALATRGLEKPPENHAGDGQPSGLPAAHGSAS